MRKSIPAVALALMAFASSIGAASAATSSTTATVTATVTAGNIGIRSIGAVPNVNLVAVAGSSSVTGSMAANVIESAVTGANPWTLSAAIGTLTLPVLGDTITNDLISISARNTATVPLTGMGTITTPSGTQDMSATRTLISNAQDDTKVYTGTYLSTANLAVTVPNGNHVGAYSGTLTITLVQ
jgi:hypothetical protein